MRLGRKGRGNPPNAMVGRTRYDERELRGIVRGMIMADPGLRRDEILGRIGAAEEGLAGQLEALERERRIRSGMDGGAMRYYPAGPPGAGRAGALTGLQQLILNAVSGNEGQSTRGVAKLLGIPPSAVEKSAGKMERLRFLRLEKGIFGTRCYLGEGAGNSDPSDEGE